MCSENVGVLGLVVEGGAEGLYASNADGCRKKAAHGWREKVGRSKGRRALDCPTTSLQTLGRVLRRSRWREWGSDWFLMVSGGVNNSEQSYRASPGQIWQLTTAVDKEGRDGSSQPQRMKVKFVFYTTLLFFPAVHYSRYAQLFWLDPIFFFRTRVPDVGIWLAAWFRG